jgi:hypothetical protein
MTYTPNKTYAIDGYNWLVEDSGASYAIQAIGTSTIQFEVNPGDIWSYDPSTKFRSELESTIKIASGTPINISYVFNVATGSVNSASWMVVGQLYQDTGGCPPFSVGMAGQKMQITIGYTGANGQPVYLTVFQDPNDIVEGQDYAMNISVTFSPAGAGHLVVTRNGQTIVNYTGPLGYNGQSYVYWKEGVYESGDATTNFTASYSNLSLTTGTPAAQAAFDGVQSFNTYDGSGNLLTKTVNTYDSSRILVSTSIYNADGALTLKTTYNSDGSKEVDAYLITGKPYVSTVALYDSSGVQTSISQYGSSGQAYYGQTVDSSGNVNKYYYTSAGVLQKATTDFADGTHSQTTYAGTAGTNPMLTYRTWNANWVATLYETYSSGNLTAKTVYNSDGSKTLTEFAGVAGTNPIQTYATWNSAGVLTLYEKFNSAGVLSWKTLYYSSGAKSEVDTYLITGQAYTSQSIMYGVDGVATSTTQYYSNGNIYYQSFTDSAGAAETKYYSSAGVLQKWQINYADGTKQVSNYNSASGALLNMTDYNASGAVTYAKSVNADGSYTVNQYLIAGQPYVTEYSSYSASGVLQSDSKYDSKGLLYSTYSLSSTGVATTNSYAAGVMQESIQTSPSGPTTDKLFVANLVANAVAGAETFTSYHNDTFAFGSKFGADTIKGFNAGSGATHDIIQLSAALVPDFAHLKMAQSGANTVISVGTGESITLTGVSVSALTASDFRFP